MSAFEKNEFLRNISFSVHLFNQIRMQTTFLENSANFQMIRDDVVLCQCTCSRALVKDQFLPLNCPEHSIFPLVLSKKQTYMNDFIQ